MDILVGFRFHPTDQEIICLLMEKRRDPSMTVHAILETNIYDFEPPELSGLSPIQSDRKWSNFFCAPNYMNAGRKRVCRATETGYWKLTGEGYSIKDKLSKREIGYKRVLVFYERPGGSKEIKTNWVMHQFSATDSPLYKKDFVVCRVKKQENKKRRISTNIGDQQQKKLRGSSNCQVQPSHNMTLDNENTSSELQLPITENTPQGLPLSITENTYPNPELQLPVLEDTYPKLQLPVAPVIENTYQSPSVENTSLESHQLPNNCSDSIYNTGLDAVDNTLPVDHPQLATFNALNGSNWLSPSSFSAVHSPVNPEQESSSSVVSTDDYNGLVSLLSIAREEDIPLNVQDAYTSEEHGDSALHINSSKSSPRFCGGDTNETDTEFFEWVKYMFECNIRCVSDNAIFESLTLY